MKTRDHLRTGERGGVGQWVVLVLTLVAVAVVYFITKKPGSREAARPPVAESAPVPVTPMAPLAPAPKPVVQATPTPTPAPAPAPAPVVAATPLPTPTSPTLDLATVARAPALWPPVVALVQSVSLPLAVDGRVVGQARLPVGTSLRLLRVVGEQVEIEYQKAKRVIPAASTDLMQRALVRLKAGDSATPADSRPLASTVPAQPVLPTANGAPGGSTAIESDPVRLSRQITLDVVPMKSTRTEGGDFDDKKDRFKLKSKFVSLNTGMATDTLSGEIYVFGESMTDRNVRNLLAFETFTFSMTRRGTFEHITKEVVTAYDDSVRYGRFGIKYESWLIRIRNKAGTLVFEKSNSPTLQKVAAKVTGLKVGSNYDRKTFEESKFSR